MRRRVEAELVRLRGDLEDEESETKKNVTMLGNGEREEEEEAKMRCDTGIELVEKESPWSLGAFHLLTYDCGCPTPQKVASSVGVAGKSVPLLCMYAASPVPRLLVGIRPPSAEPAHAHHTRTEQQSLNNVWKRDLVGGGSKAA